MIVPPKIKPTFLRNNELVKGKGKLSSLGKNTFQIFLQSQLACSFLYWFVIYHWKSFEKNYNFVIENTLIRIDTNFTKLLKLLFLEHMVGPKEEMCLKFCVIIFFHMNFN
jgi:hypothetical protein